MAIRQIVQYEDSEGSKALAKASVKFDFNSDVYLDYILEDLWDSLDAHETGVGLAGVQIDIAYRIFVMKGEKRRREFINPVILKKSTTIVKDNEGCLSRPGVEKIRGRCDSVLLQWQNCKGKTCRKVFRGLEARIIQHEMDHLNGKDCLYG
ncbi:MAG: peptide deformylase [Candidatus Omnitrophica bacterium]|nr:peptide deformylase [Candidatus Omnitrophota bacterium]